MKNSIIEKIKPEFHLGDILIKRVSNGWLVAQGSIMEENEIAIFVYEDKENPNYMSESLYNLLADQFQSYLQSKRNPGIKMSFSHLTKEQEENAAYS